MAWLPFQKLSRHKCYYKSSFFSNEKVGCFCELIASKYLNSGNLIFRAHLNTWLNPIKINLSLDQFSDKNQKILNPPVFSENLINFQTKYFGAAGWTDFFLQISGNFPQNILMGTQFRNL